MIWSLSFLDKRQARIIRDETSEPVCGYLDWLTAHAITEAHNRDIDRLGRAPQAVDPEQVGEF